MRFALLSFSIAFGPMVFASACTGGSANDAGSDVATDVGFGADADANTDAAAPTCSSALEGTDRFGAVLAGDGHFVAPVGPGTGTGEVRAAIYFPHGRTPGAEAILAIDQVWPRQTVFASSAVIAADSSAGPFQLLNYRDSIRATLGPGTTSIHAHVARNFAMGSDVLEIFEADVDLCPIGTAPPPVISVVAPRLAPTTPIDLGVSVPNDTADVQMSASTSGGVNVPLVTSPGATFRAMPLQAWPPGATISLDTTHWRDVLGRPYVLSPIPVPLVATQPVADLAFDTMPSPESADFDGVVPSLTSGMLRMATNSFDSHPFSALLALGTPPAGLTHVVVRVGGQFATSAETRIAIVTANGSAAAIDIASASPADVSASIPGPGPLWLSISVGAQTNDPQRSQLPPPPVVVLLDEVRFE